MHKLKKCKLDFDAFFWLSNFLDIYLIMNREILATDSINTFSNYSSSCPTLYFPLIVL